jgi:DNA repair photolyase
MERTSSGRGATTNPPPRFVASTTSACDDGWWADETPHSIATEVRPEAARTVLTRNDSPDLPFHVSINPDRGCEHGCVYCYARPSHAYLDLSPGIDFETRLYYKADAARLLRAELARPGYRCEPVMLGANTDPYQPVERTLGVTRSILEVLLEHRHPVTIITKGTLAMRDLDLLGEFARQGLLQFTVSLTTLDDALKRSMEPRAASGAARLKLMRSLAGLGVPVTVLAAPVIPAVNDAELESLLEAAAGAGASRAGYVLLRLPHELKELFADWLQQALPLRAAHVLSLLRQSRGGRLNDPRFGLRMKGDGPYAQMIKARFALSCRRLRLDTGPAPRLDTSSFRPPAPDGQLDLALG